MKRLSDDYRGATISEGTLRTDDIVAAMRPVLEQYDEGRELLIAFETETDVQCKLDILDEMFDFMDSVAPEGCAFCAHPGDGSLFGFWPEEILG